MKTNLFLMLITIMNFLAVGAFANGNGDCAERHVILGHLQGKYGETRQMMGLALNNEGIVEMHASTETGTWTITLTHPNGITCMLAAGTAFELIKPTGEPT